MPMHGRVGGHAERDMKVTVQIVLQADDAADTPTVVRAPS